MNYDTQSLDRSTDMTPVTGTVDLAIPVSELWECFTHANHWPRWNPCMFWVQNQNLILGQQLVWAFAPIRWWYLYLLPGVAKIVEVEPNRKVTWEVTALPGFYARHTYFVEDLGKDCSRFGSWEKAMGPTFRLFQWFWIAHFVFVKDQSLAGAQELEAHYQRSGKLESHHLRPKNYWRSLVFTLILILIIVALLSILFPR